MKFDEVLQALVDRAAEDPLFNSAIDVINALVDYQSALTFVLAKTLGENHILHENLTNVQARCTELLQEVRNAKGA